MGEDRTMQELLSRNLLLNIGIDIKQLRSLPLVGMTKKTLNQKFPYTGKRHIMLNSFSIARLPRIEFGPGVIAKLPEICQLYGRRILLVTGGQSFDEAPWSDAILLEFKAHHIDWLQFKVSEEPSPQLVDDAVKAYADEAIDVVVAVGGGSALDAAKAIAGLLRVQRTVMDYLEGVGPELSYQGPAVPFIAVPTTAGTGSEATKNAVLSVHGLEGFKKSFRDDRLVAEYALVDPDLLASCPTPVIAANGMDALTQLLESYVSTRSNALTDSLAISGLRAVRDGLLPMFNSGGKDAEARERMAYGSMLSGICLAQTGLGSVHGLASPLGAFYPIPHGMVCGTLVAEATRVNIQAIKQREPDNPLLAKYARLGDVLSQKKHRHLEKSCQALIDLLADWTCQLKLEGLGSYGLGLDGIAHVVAHCRGSSMKTNPIILSDEELAGLLQARL